MSVAAELVGLSERAAQRLANPRVRALHLPRPEMADQRDGEFCALELDDGSLGLTFVLLDDTLARLAGDPHRQDLAGADALTVARWYAEGAGTQRTIGFAAINALTRSLFQRAGFEPDTAADSLGQLAPQAGDDVGMIGLFPSLVDRITQAGARLVVLELRPELSGEQDGYRVTLDPAELGTCNKVLSTSSVLLNDTLDQVLAGCPQARWFAVVGPGGGCPPDPLFAQGVTLLGGAWVHDREGFLDALAAGQTWGRFARKYAIPREGYPGFESLLERAGT